MFKNCESHLSRDGVKWLYGSYYDAKIIKKFKFYFKILDLFN